MVDIIITIASIEQNPDGGGTDHVVTRIYRYEFELLNDAVKFAELPYCIEQHPSGLPYALPVTFDGHVVDGGQMKNA